MDILLAVGVGLGALTFMVVVLWKMALWFSRWSTDGSYASHGEMGETLVDTVKWQALHGMVGQRLPPSGPNNAGP
ncbi:MAG: hypothetical protein EHM70_23140 [Chloroflexota bacterium]|nr:MAG: hypothetical protein EHM70_23140 [Chloroflexota bacterium]